jgi:hypothetical protein
MSRRLFTAISLAAATGAMTLGNIVAISGAYYG